MDEGREPEGGSTCATLDPRRSTLDALTLEELRLHRPDLLRELEVTCGQELQSLRERLNEATAEEAKAQRREVVTGLLEEHELLPPAKGGAAGSRSVSDVFFATLLNTDDDDNARRLIEDRAAIVRQSQAVRAVAGGRPKSRDQLTVAGAATTASPRTAAEFASAVRGQR